MRIAICDDNGIDRSIISDFLHIYMTEKSVSAHFIEYESGVTLLFDVEDGNYYDLIFLDIYMARVHGMDIARQLREHGYSGKIVFITSTPDFAVDSYEVDAAGYLLKPHNYEKIRTLLDRIVDRASIGAFQVTVRGNIYSIPYKEIVFVESSNNICKLHRNDGIIYTVYQKLGDIEKQLDDPRFLRCHQSYIVNMRYIAKVGKQFELTTGEVVLIRQRNLKELRDTYLEYSKLNKKS